jgi:PIN domain nuclease of toxin-antitoxin system
MGGPVRFLIDTHVLIWSLGTMSELPKRIVGILSDPANSLVVSAATAFEIATKYRIGKLPEAEPLVLAYDELMHEINATQLTISTRHGLTAGQLAWDHRDPFDRILAAQSILENLPLVTSDAVFASFGGVQTVWG